MARRCRRDADLDDGCMEKLMELAQQQGRPFDDKTKMQCRSCRVRHASDIGRFTIDSLAGRSCRRSARCCRMICSRPLRNVSRATARLRAMARPRRDETSLEGRSDERKLKKRLARIPCPKGQGVRFPCGTLQKRNTGPRFLWT